MTKIQNLILAILFLLFGAFVLSNCSGENAESNEEVTLYEDEKLEEETEDLENEPEEEVGNENLESEAIENDWDEALTEYESFVDEYIELLKKAVKGDASAMSQYPTIMQKAQESSKKLDEAKGDLSPEQLQHFMAIQQKLAKAASEIK